MEFLALLMRLDIHLYYAAVVLVYGKYPYSTTVVAQLCEEKLSWVHHYLKAGVGKLGQLLNPAHKAIQINRYLWQSLGFMGGELLTKKLKPHSEWEFVKKCLVAAAKLLAPDKVKVSLSLE